MIDLTTEPLGRRGLFRSNCRYRVKHEFHFWGDCRRLDLRFGHCPNGVDSWYIYPEEVLCRVASVNGSGNTLSNIE